jgi:hypothetical protein
MSAITRCCVASALALFAVAPAFANLPSRTPVLPAVVAAHVPDAKVQGEGELAWFGLPIYEGTLWSVDGTFSFDEPFALDLRYRRSLDGRRIAERSVEEMRAIGGHDPAAIVRWGEAMARLFPDVRSGDHIAGVHLPGYGAKFFLNGRALGDIADPAFARAFFGIWLDRRTSRPDFRDKLLGVK